MANSRKFRKILVSVKFVSAILGPEMGAPILWTPGKNAFFLQEKPMSVKFPFLGFFFGGGGGSADFIFMGALTNSRKWSGREGAIDLLALRSKSFPRVFRTIGNLFAALQPRCKALFAPWRQRAKICQSVQLLPYSFSHSYGAKFHTPPPPTPENTGGWGWGVHWSICR